MAYQVSGSERSGHGKMELTYSITLEEKKTQIDELRSRMKGLMKEESYEDDTLFRRFLRARDYNINAAEEMLKKCLEWRKINKMDTILTDYAASEILDKYFSLSHFGYDKEGCPLSFFDFGNLDIRGMLRCMKLTEIIRYLLWTFEIDIRRMKESSAKLEKTVEQFSYVINLENFSLRATTHKSTIDFLTTLALTFDANYPERLKTAFVVNAPVYFTLFFAVLSPFISRATTNKIKIFGRDHWKEELLKCIDADVLPAFLGGNRTDPDGNLACKTFIKTGQLIPEHYYIIRNSHKFRRQPGAKKLTVARGSKEEVRLFVLHQGSRIEYEFDVKNNDIAFYVLYGPNANNMSETEELIPKQKINTDIGSETGVFSCGKPGVYVLVFDNTYSWIHHKEIYYTATILSPYRRKSLLN